VLELWHGLYGLRLLNQADQSNQPSRLFGLCGLTDARPSEALRLPSSLKEEDSRRI
jgi:hypothetical protein